MRTSLFVILVLSWTFFSIYNLTMMIGALVGFFPLTTFTGVYYSHLSGIYLYTLLGVPSVLMGVLATFLTKSRFWGMLNALLAGLLVVVEINFSLLVSYGYARDINGIIEVFKSSEIIFGISALSALLMKP